MIMKARCNMTGHRSEQEAQEKQERTVAQTNTLDSLKT